MVIKCWNTKRGIVPKASITKMSEQWAYNDGAIGFIKRPVTTDKLKRILETESQSAKALSDEDLTFVNTAGVADIANEATVENTDGTVNIFI